MAENVEGVIYLLHFERPYRHAKHYIGWTADLMARLAAHRSGAGARLLAVLKSVGIGFECVRTWKGTRTLERRLKTLGGASRLCPVCSPGKDWGGFKKESA